MVITEEHINAAFDQVETIALIHEDENDTDKFEAIKTYQTFLGMTDEAGDELVRRTRDFIPDADINKARAISWVYIGVILGLSSATKALESG